MKKAIPLILLSIALYACDSAKSNESARGSSMKPAPKAVKKIDQNNIYPIFEGVEGPMQINGTLPGSVKGLVKIYETEGKDYFLLDSAVISEGQFTLNINKSFPGIYKIGVDETKLGDIILNPEEGQIELSYSGSNFAYNLTSTSSSENQSYSQYLKNERKHKNKIRTIRQSGKDRDTKRSEIFQEQANFKSYQDQAAEENEGSFFANLLRHLQSPNRFDKNRYWDDMDFNDKSLIRSTVWPDRIEDYMRLHASKEKSDSDRFLGFYNAVDLIANKVITDGNDEVLEYVLYTLSEGFYSSNMQELSLYVIDNYFYGDACGDAEISELFKMKAAGIRKLQIGNQLPDFTLNSQSGQSFTLSKVAKDQDLTLVLFWASFCHKCEEEIPEVKNIYKDFQSKGFEILAVSVDTKRNDWISGIAKHRTSWPNVSDLKGWRSPVAQDFRVTSTPVMFVVNKDMEVLSRPKNTNELRNFLNKKLN